MFGVNKMKIAEVQNLLKKNSNNKVKDSFQRFIPSSEKVYGVKVPILNELANKLKNEDFDFVEQLWKSGAFEEKLLASKILGKICKKNPDKTLELTKKFGKDIADWAVCDTLATQGIRVITKIKQDEIFEISKKLIKSKNFWERRFALVLLINFVKGKLLPTIAGSFIGHNT